VEKSSPKTWPTFEIFIKLSNVNNHPMGENSPDLVTLEMTGNCLISLLVQPAVVAAQKFRFKY
jgi:hypothetical protein